MSAKLRILPKNVLKIYSPSNRAIDLLRMLYNNNKNVASISLSKIRSLPVFDLDLVLLTHKKDNLTLQFYSFLPGRLEKLYQGLRFALNTFVINTNLTE